LKIYQSIQEIFISEIEQDNSFDFFRMYKFSMFFTLFLKYRHWQLGVQKERNEILLPHLKWQPEMEKYEFYPYLIWHFLLVSQKYKDWDRMPGLSPKLRQLRP
jgi:hypothetical protein